MQKKISFILSDQTELIKQVLTIIVAVNTTLHFSIGFRVGWGLNDIN